MSSEDLLEQQSPNSSDEVSECSNLNVSTEQPPSLFIPQHNNLDESASINSDVGLTHASLQYSNLRFQRNGSVYIRNSEILRGEEATLAKAMDDIKKSCPSSRSFRLTLTHPDCHSDEHQQLKDTEDGIPQECSEHQSESASSSKESLSLESKENAHQLMDQNSPLTSEVDVEDNGQHQPASKNGIHNDTTMGNPQSCSEFDNVGKDDSSTSAESDSFEEDCDTDSSDFHLELTQNVSEMCSITITGDSNIVGQTDDSEPCSDSEEVFDAHRSIQQQVTHTGSKSITKINKHSRSKLSTSIEVLQQKSTKVSAEVTAATTDINIVNEKFQCVTSDTKVRGGEVRVATANAKVIDTKVQIGTVMNKVEGAELKFAAADIKGLKAQTGATLSMTTKALTTTAGSVDLVAGDVDIQATAEATVQGVSCQSATTTITGAREKAKVDTKATVSGVKIQGGVADIAGMKSGVTAEATAEATGLDVKIGTTQASGMELSATTTASASVGAEVSITNFRASGFDGVGAHASVKAKAGMEILSANVGISGTAGIYASTIPRIGCITIAPGAPKIGIGTGFLNYAIGGGVEGESGQHAGDATAGKPQGNSGNRNGCSGAGTGEVGGIGNNTVGGVEGTVLLGTSLSLGHGPSDIHSESVHLNGSANGHSALGNDLSSKTHSPSVTPGDSNNGQVHNSNPNMPQLQSHVHHSDNNRYTKGPNAVSVNISETPFHLKAFHKLKQKHLVERNHKQGKVKSQPLSGSPAGHNLLSGQGSGPKHHVQLHGPGAKLQAMINECYPSLPGESKSDSSTSTNYKQYSSDSEIEHVKKATINRLNNLRKAGLQLEGSDSMPAAKNSTNPPRKKAEPFGSRKHIHTLACLKNDESSKDIVKINSDKIHGFEDQDI